MRNVLMDEWREKSKSRAEKIVEMRRGGATWDEIANQYGITRQRVAQIVQKTAPELIGPPNSGGRRKAVKIT